MIRRYRYISYWWLGPTRTVDGEYSFVAEDDSAAIRHAHAKFEEAIVMCDQSAVVDEGGRIVWQNGWPPTGTD